jgi:hypothetical protein
MGNNIDKHSNCQPDPVAAAACRLDLSILPTEGGTTD